jgi:hypothetical protein
LDSRLASALTEIMVDSGDGEMAWQEAYPDETVDIILVDQNVLLIHE